MRGYIAFYFLFMPSRSPTKSYLIVSPFLCPIILGCNDEWGQMGETSLLKVAMLGGASKGFSILD